MKNKIKTLIIDSGGYKFRTAITHTLVYGVLGIKPSGEESSHWLNKQKIIRHFLNRQYDALSYVNDWREAFYQRTDLDIDAVNLENLVEFSKAMKKITEFDLIIVLHSATGDNMSPLLKSLHLFQKRRSKLIVFLGNEYDLMSEKFTFVRETGADYLCSQLPKATAEWLYANLGRTKILSLPHALNPRLYNPGNEHYRDIDIGFRGALYYRFIGDEERNLFIKHMEKIAPQKGLTIDFSYKTIHRGEWADFLRRCKGIPGAESGTYFLDREGFILSRAKKYEQAHPGATLDEIKRACFVNIPEHISGKCISSRHFEPIGTKTCQILLEGEYNGILKANEHYLAVKKDYSNLEEIIRCFRDDDYRKSIVEKAYEYVISEHTYEHRVNSLMNELAKDGL